MSTGVGVIYSLSDPRSGRVRYVGKTIQKLSRRIQGHYRDRTKNHRTAWLESLRREGCSPSVAVLETLPADQLSSAECRWIARLRADGADLVNGTDGGDGTVGCVPSAEWRAKQRARSLGKRLSPEHCAAISAGKIGHVVSAATRAKLSAALRGRPSHVRTPEERAKNAAGNLGKKRSAEARAKMSESQRRRHCAPAVG